MASRKTGISAGTAVLVLVIILAVCGGAGYFAIVNAKKGWAAQEAAMPESAISTYLNHIKSGDYDAVYEDSLTVNPSLNSKDDYVAKMKEIYDGVDTDKIIYAVDAKATDTEYKLYYDNKYIANLKLIQDGSGKWLASTLFTGNNTYTIEVPAGLKITANGQSVDDSYKTATGTAASNFSGLSDTSAAPLVDTYTLTNLLGKPKIEVEGQSGYGTLDDVLLGSNTIYVGKTSTDSDLANAFINDAQIIASYPAQDGSLGQVAAVSMTNSDWYSRISTLQNTWFTSHSTSQFSNVAASNIIQQSDDSAVGYVTFDYYAANSEVNHTWHGGFQITFLKSGGAWKIAGMAVDSELNPARQ